MTTYAYRVTLDDSELIAVHEALTHYRAFCESELANGPKAPYWAHRRSIDAVLIRLSSDSKMMSTNSYLYPKTRD